MCVYLLVSRIIIANTSPTGNLVMSKIGICKLTLVDAALHIMKLIAFCVCAELWKIMKWIMNFMMNYKIEGKNKNKQTLS